MTKDNRSFPRKPLRAPAQVRLQTGAILRGRTIDIALAGVSLLIEQQLPAGATCAFMFETQINGAPRRVVANAKVAYSILSGTEGFRIGLAITDIDAASNK